MGGDVALTIRFTPERQWRGVTTTNVLGSLWDAPFYGTLEECQAHVEAWLKGILERRLENPALQEYDKYVQCAPDDYGLVVIDFVSSTIMSAQGYTSLTRISRVCVGQPSRPVDTLDNQEKWDALSAMGAVLETIRYPEIDWEVSKLRLPFATVIDGYEDLISEETLKWADDTLGLSDAEKATWREYIKDHDLDGENEDAESDARAQGG